MTLRASLMEARPLPNGVEMPLFHFKVEGDPDEEVIHLPSIVVAKCEAVKYAGQRICDEADSFWDAGQFTLTVADEHGLTLAVLMMTGVESPVSSTPKLPSFD